MEYAIIEIDLTKLITIQKQQQKALALSAWCKNQ